MKVVAFRRLTISCLLLFLTLASSLIWAVDLTPAEIVAKHLAAVGTEQARTQIKSRVVQGGSTYRVLVGGTGAIDGKFVFASEGQKSNFLFKINANGFMGEQFICDGNKTSVAGTHTDKTRSEFGNFVLSQDTVLRENLLGGVWSSGWPLLNIDARKATLRSEGLKKADGHEYLVLRYQPKKITDMDISLYFDPQTYRHLMTIYKVTITGGIGEFGETSSARKQETRYRIEERFSEFKAVDGLTLPNHYDLRFTLELDNGFTKAIEWEVRALGILNNQSVDPRSFEVK